MAGRDRTQPVGDIQYEGIFNSIYGRGMDYNAYTPYTPFTPFTDIYTGGV
jgi:hypothetical protein